MSIIVSAIGIGLIGTVIGYFLFYSYKRQHQPITQSALPIRDVLLLLTAVGAGGVIGKVYVDLEGINYIGPYGIGLFAGVFINAILTITHERPFSLRK